ncbi:MAG: hypothetical protein FJ109_08575 [Deltaproteobacteria bacterium]|nr:hypothetical protein [Deltaproteobacteria bacterium]
MKERGRAEQWLRRGIAICEDLLARARRDIVRLSDDPDPAWTEMERRFDEYTMGTGSRIGPGELVERLAGCQVVMVGGVSTSPHGIELVGRLMERLRGCAVALNVPSCERQPELDRFLEGRIALPDLHGALDFDACAPEHVWPVYRRFLERARVARVPVVLYESGVSQAVEGRDADSLLLLDAALHVHSERPLIVLTGELRATPESLLGGVQRQHGADRVAALYCDLPGPYFSDLLDGGSGRGWFALRPGRWCECRQSPLARLQSFLSFHALYEIPVRGDRLSVIVPAMVKRIARALGLSMPAVPRVGVLGPGDPRLLSLASACNGIDDEGLEFLAQCMAAGESRMIPEAGLLYVGNVATGHVAEEAAHWLRSLTGGHGYCTEGEDAFWGVAVHELLAWYGSKVLSPGRVPPGISDLGPGEGTRGEALAHVYGYNLAERLYSASSDAAVRDWVRAAFQQDLVERGTAKRLYLAGLDLAARSARSRRSGRKAPAGERKGR